MSAEKFLADKYCDFISMSRPLIYEPDLPNRWKSGDFSSSKCISCKKCLNFIHYGAGLHCFERESAM